MVLSSTPSACRVGCESAAKSVPAVPVGQGIVALEGLSRLTPAKAYDSVARVSERLLGNSQARPLAVSKASPPIKPLKGTARTDDKDPSNMDFQDYKAWREKNKRPYGVTR